MWDLIVSVPDHCLSFYFSLKKTHADILDKDNSNLFIINATS